MPNIGIFWFAQGCVIGRSLPFKKGECGLPGLWDSPDNHVDLWEASPNDIGVPVALRQTDYQSVPRGRVIYDERKRATLIYMDKSLFNDVSKQRIRAFFQLEGQKIIWRCDPHYRVF